MASAFMRGLRSPGGPLQILWAIPVARAAHRYGRLDACSLITRQRTVSHCQKRACHGTHIFREQEISCSHGDGTPREIEDCNHFFNFPSQSPAEAFQQGKIVTVHGFISKRRDLSKKNAFVDLLVDSGPAFQFRSSWENCGSPSRDVHKALKTAPAWSPVALTGRIESFQSSPGVAAGPGFPVGQDGYQLTLLGVHLLNSFPKDIIVSEGAIFPPKLRHLQLRFDKVLQDRLRFRNELTAKADEYLRRVGFSHVETPILFKSTPEGAREFLVPTRRPGFAYALPQSPQQYKQMLMASGVRKYFQFARCFRDEDLRADRQPEFTQLDLEMSFVTGKDVMALVEGLVHDFYEFIRLNWRTREVDGELGPIPAVTRPANSEDEEDEHVSELYPSISSGSETRRDDANTPFARITYDEAMSQYGSDKPDLRIPNKIQRIEHFLSPVFISMISDLENPIVEACVFRFQRPSQNMSKESTEDQEPPDFKTIQAFITSTWDSLPKALGKNPDGQPVPILMDSSRPLSGLASLGHEAAAKILSSPDLALEDGDVLVIQARPKTPFSGGATALGTLRKHIYDEAVAARLLPLDRSFHFLWVTAFPLFTRTDQASATASDPGQGGAAGFAATHHPFTAPLAAADFALLAHDPLAARADHYDLVANGVELGGGSRRIHVAGVQEHVLRRVLRMGDAAVAPFAHLLEALRAGCPPHAGFAFGWDRVCATLAYAGSVRDVIAFPKSKRGEEPVARVPGRVGAAEWAVYGLREVEGG